MGNSACVTCLWELETGDTVDRSRKSKDWAKLVGVTERSVRRHWEHAAPANVVGPSWEPVSRATRVEVAVVSGQTMSHGGLRLAMKGSDTQVGYRLFPDGSTESFHDEKAMELFVNIASMYQPHEIDLLGDLLDLPSQGKYAKEASFAQTTQMAIDYLHAWLSKLRAVCPDAKITIIEGNHDKRMQNFVEMNALAAFGLRRAELPDSWPVMSIPYLLRLDEIGIEYVDAYPAATKWDNSTTRNIHGTRANSVGSTTSQYVKELPHINTWAGHTHRVEITYKSVIGSWGEPLESYSANPGCLCRSDGSVPSVKGAIGADGRHGVTVEDWQQGFGFCWYNETESWPSVYRIRNGRTIMNGIEINYEGKIGD